MTNWIVEYRAAIHDGRATAGKWVTLLYDALVEGIESGRYFYDAKKATAAIRFIENFCHHHEGVLAPGLLKLELWQKALVASIFGIIDESGARQFREVFLVVGRKNGKTLLAAAIAAYMTFLDGEYGARIYFAAPKLEQANLCFDAYQQIIYQEPELDDLSQKRRTDIYVQDNNSSARPIAYNAKKSDGLNIHLCVADEIASWQGDQGLKFYEVLKSSFGARKQPLLLAMSTAGYVHDGIYDELMKRATRLLLGDSRESRLLPVIYMIDDITKWDDLQELKKANPNLGVSITEDYLTEEAAIATGSLSKKSEFLTKYCNIKQNSSQAFFAATDIEAITGEPLTLDDFRGCYCVGGVDLSQTTDITAATVLIERDGKIYTFCQFFLPTEKIDEATERDGMPYNAYLTRGLLRPSGENYIDYKSVSRWFMDLVEKYQIYPLKIGYDRYSATYLVDELKGYGFHMDDVYQGENLWPVLQELEGKVKDRTINIMDNDLLKAHFLNAAVKMSTERGRGRLVKITPTARIDGVAAVTDALTVRQKWYAEIGEQLMNKKEDDENESN